MDRFLTRTLAVCLSAALAVFVALPAQAQDRDEKASMKKEADIVQTAMSAGTFETLVSALQAADLVEALKGEGPFTVFAPTDEAFAALPEGTLDDLLKSENKSKLQSILKYHVVQGKAKASDVTGMEEAETLDGAKIGIKTKDGAVMLTGKNEATVTKTDVMASNGVIHVIDSVLMPPERTAMKENE
jgi:uncharacterized surface protein with fasciclin (FAS1) repeats